MSLKALVIFCFVVIGAQCCSAQVGTASSASNGSTSTSRLSDRQIEVLVRSQFSVPPDYDVVLGLRSPSDTANFYKLPITFVHQGKQTIVDFLISKDGSTLARLQTFDIRNNPALSIDVKGRPVRGDPGAKVEIVNFDDLECPFCAALNNEILPETLDRYKGLIKVVYKDLPIEGHLWATHAAVDANCLASLSSPAYWAYVDYVHSHGQAISGEHADLDKSSHLLDEAAHRIGGKSRASEPELLACLKTQDQNEIQSSLKLGSRLGIDHVPQMFVDGERLPAGVRPTTELWPVIDRALRAQGIDPPAETKVSASPAARPNQ